MSKVIRSYSIEKNLYEWFDKHSKSTSLNKSGFISQKIEELKKEIENKTKETKPQENQ